MTPPLDPFSASEERNPDPTHPSPKPPAEPTATSVLGPTLVFKGELTAGEDLLIQGQVEGSIKHNERNLTIGTEGKIKADIRARNIVVEGKVEGDMYGSEAVVVQETAKVRGNIYAPRVALKEGARFKGGIDMDPQPAAVAKPPKLQESVSPDDGPLARPAGEVTAGAQSTGKRARATASK